MRERTVQEFFKGFRRTKRNFAGLIKKATMRQIKVKFFGPIKTGFEDEDGFMDILKGA